MQERLGLEDGARVMTLTNIASTERTAKRVTLFGKDGHALNLLFSDEKSAGHQFDNDAPCMMRKP